MTDQSFAEWIGRSTEAEDILTNRLVASFRAIFGDHLAAVPDGAAPLGIHWCLSPAIVPAEAIGPDGHPAKNRDLPPIPNPRRMWAGGEIETFSPLAVGETVRRVSTIRDISRKTGRSGDLWFVTISHEYFGGDGLAIRDRQDIVYRQPAAPSQRAPEPEMAGESYETRVIDPDPVLLFRYSAITFNGHRIHYDLPYATGEEGYAGLVVHGPLQATLLFNMAARNGDRVPTRFSYRGLSPAFAGQPLSICAGPDNLFWTARQDGAVHMRGTADYTPR